MSRYVSIDFILNETDEFGYENGVLYGLSGNSAPTIDIPQWIPCSERLPSDSGEHLVTVGTRNAFVDVLYFGKPLMPNRKVKGKCFYKADDEWGDIVDDDVIAWMPLPKPYGEREGE